VPLLDPAELSGLDPPDNNAVGVGAMPSIQGYTSTVDGVYASATGSHQATGDGQDTLAPAAVADGTLDQLGTTVLLTPPEYLVTSAGGNGPAAGPAGTGRRDLAADQRASWYLGAASDVAKVELPDPDAVHDAALGIRIELTAPGGSTRWFRADAVTSSTLAIPVTEPVAGVAVVAQAHEAPGALGPPSVVAADGSVVVADGQLQGALIPPRWQFAGFDGPFAVFANHLAPFFGLVGDGGEARERIMRACQATAERMVDGLLAVEAVPSVWGHMGTTEGAFFWPVVS